MAATNFSPGEREIDLAQWTLVLSAEAIAERMLELCGALTEEQCALPRWRWFKRRRIGRYASAAYRLMGIFHAYAREQDEAHAPKSQVEVKA